ncbi:MAG: DUF5615 family PIN-like protein [Betaproteobacteria bacterium]|nr:DUF5615 family PIN-like protein [Betaproteobacteria bacterium]
MDLEGRWEDPDVDAEACSGSLAHAVRAINLPRSDDVVIFDRAAAEDRIVVSADTDFGTLLAVRSTQKPSVISFRGQGSRKPEALAHAILSHLPPLADALESGSIVTFEPSRIRSCRARQAFSVSQEGHSDLFGKRCFPSPADSLRTQANARGERAPAKST